MCLAIGGTIITVKDIDVGILGGFYRAINLHGCFLSCDINSFKKLYKHQE
ncbi:hypothetical protein HMPREF9069_00372 [Atopobium sp. oral taxon 810 str. F0209]|nr:hypothetical protein HMPREF9069_00372 [Atopobium sp. oral taxon 810 str. F0209]